MNIKDIYNNNDNNDNKQSYHSVVADKRAYISILPDRFRGSNLSYNCMHV